MYAKKRFGDTFSLCVAASAQAQHWSSPWCHTLQPGFKPAQHSQQGFVFMGQMPQRALVDTWYDQSLGDAAIRGAAYQGSHLHRLESTSSTSAHDANKLNSDRHRSNRKAQRDDGGHSWQGHEARDAGSQGPVCRWLQIPTPSQRSSRYTRHRSSGQAGCDIRERLLLARTFRMQFG